MALKSADGNGISTTTLAVMITVWATTCGLRLSCVGLGTELRNGCWATPPPATVTAAVPSVAVVVGSTGSAPAVTDAVEALPETRTPKPKPSWPPAGTENGPFQLRCVPLTVGSPLTAPFELPAT